MRYKILPDIDDRKFWEKIGKSERFKSLIENIIDRAEKIPSKPIESIKASWFLKFYRTGDRSFCEEKYRIKRENLNKLVLAECFENQSKFLDPINDYIWAICEESSWTIPAHGISARTYGDGLPDIENPTVALFSGITSLNLSITYFLLKEKLHPMVRKRIEYEIKRRIIDPYLSKDFMWLKIQNNWNAVCNNTVVWSAILILKDKEIIQKVLNKAIKSLPLYIDGFGDDGGTSEGINYWNFGFSHYVMTAYIVEKYTKGKINLLNQEKIKKIAMFPVLIELSPDKYINFADATEYSKLNRIFLQYLGEKLNIPVLKTFASTKKDDISLLNLYQLFELIDKIHLKKIPRKTSYYKKNFFFKDLEWFISRKNPDDLAGLVFAAKCGHNGEMHNHNDVGSFILHYAGESYIADTGAPVYTRKTFSEERYSLLPCSSSGHSVPVINGFYQKEGEKYRGKVLEARSGKISDIFRIEISGSYPEEAEIARFERKFTFLRKGKGVLIVEDILKFKKPSEVEETFITFLNVKKRKKNEIIIEGEKGQILLTCRNNDLEMRIEKYSLKMIEKRPEPHIKFPLKRIIWKSKTPQINFNFVFEFKVI